MQFLYSSIYKSHFHMLSFALFISERKTKVQKKHSQRVFFSLKNEGEKDQQF